MYLYFYFPIIDKNEIPHFDILMQIRIRNIYPFLCAYQFLVGKSEYIHWQNGQCIVDDLAHPEFGSLQVAKQGDIIRFGFIYLPYMFNDLELCLVGTM